MPNKPTADPLIRFTEAKKILGLRRHDQVERLVKAGEIREANLPKCIRTRLFSSSVYALLEKMQGNAPASP